MESYTLYFSEKCKFSMKFINQLKTNQDLFKKCRKIEISQVRGQIPPYIKSVPSLIVTTNGQSSLLVNKDLFLWLNSKTASQNPSHQPQGGNGQILDWDVCAMGGGTYSDNFSFLDAPQQATMKNFTYLDSAPQQLNCPQEGDNYKDVERPRGDDYSKSQTNMDYERMIEQRNADMPQAPPRL